MKKNDHQYRVDYHVHPNFRASRARTRAQAQAWWDAFAVCGLDAVVVTEHVYKRPKESFFFLAATKPSASTTEIFPGIEILTREGADLIVYADDPKELYAPSQLLKPYGLSYEAAVHEIRERGLHGYVTHPTTLGTTSVLRRCGRTFTRSMIAELGVVERHNAGYIDLAGACGRLPQALFGRIARELLERSNMPLDLYDHIDACRWVGGSDAHYPHELGSHVAIPASEHSSRERLFASMTMRHEGSFIFRDEYLSSLHLARQAWNVLCEYGGKKLYQLHMRTYAAS